MRLVPLTHGQTELRKMKQSATHLAGVFLGVGVTGGSAARRRVRRLGGVMLISYKNKAPNQNRPLTYPYPKVSCKLEFNTAEY